MGITRTVTTLHSWTKGYMQRVPDKAAYKKCSLQKNGAQPEWTAALVWDFHTTGTTSL